MCVRVRAMIYIDTYMYICIYIFYTTLWKLVLNLDFVIYF